MAIYELDGQGPDLPADGSYFIADTAVLIGKVRLLNSASVWFGAAHADTRAAIEQSLPRLREMLGASGLSLADAGVFSHTPRDPQRGFTSAALARAAQESGADPAGGIVMQVSRRGLVDLYA